MPRLNAGLSSGLLMRQEAKWIIDTSNLLPDNDGWFIVVRVATTASLCLAVARWREIPNPAGCRTFCE